MTKIARTTSRSSLRAHNKDVNGAARRIKYQALKPLSKVPGEGIE